MSQLGYAININEVQASVYRYRPIATPTGGNITYTSSGRYILQNRLVYVQVRLNISAIVGGPLTDLTVSMPYPSANFIVSGVIGDTIASGFSGWFLGGGPLVFTFGYNQQDSMDTHINPPGSGVGTYFLAGSYIKK